MWPGWGTGIQGPSMLAIIWFQLGLLVNKSKVGKQETDKGGKEALRFLSCNFSFLYTHVNISPLPGTSKFRAILWFCVFSGENELG